MAIPLFSEPETGVKLLDETGLHRNLVPTATLKLLSFIIPILTESGFSTSKIR